MWLSSKRSVFFVLLTFVSGVENFFLLILFFFMKPNQRNSYSHDLNVALIYFVSGYAVVYDSLSGHAQVGRRQARGGRGAERMGGLPRHQGQDHGPH